MSRPVKLGKGFVMKGGKIAAKHVPRDAAAARREKPGGSKKVRVVKPLPAIVKGGHPRVACPARLDLDDCIRQSFMRKGAR